MKRKFEWVSFFLGIAVVGIVAGEVLVLGFLSPLPGRLFFISASSAIFAWVIHLIFKEWMVMIVRFHQGMSVLAFLFGVGVLMGLVLSPGHLFLAAALASAMMLIFLLLKDY